MSVPKTATKETSPANFNVTTSRILIELIVVVLLTLVKSHFELKAREYGGWGAVAALPVIWLHTLVSLMLLIEAVAFAKRAKLYSIRWQKIVAYTIAISVVIAFLAGIMYVSTLGGLPKWSMTICWFVALITASWGVLGSLIGKKD